jgi:REP element-mobilizing transposase RayT
MYSDPLAYLIPFGAYGTWLHGDERGSVDRQHAAYETDLLRPNADREQQARGRMVAPPFVLDDLARTIVVQTIREVCEYRRWPLHAAHVRTNHVHVVVTASNVKPEKALNDFKAYASRALNRARHSVNADRWRRHGSTRYLWTEEQVAGAIRYVLEGQGEPMACYGAPKQQSEPRP